MNRANFGNVITNGMQILSVGATTAARMLGHAEQTLNNKNVEPELTPEQKKYNEEEDFIRQTEHDYRYQNALLKSKGLYNKNQAMTDEQIKLKQTADIDRDIEKSEKRLAGGEDMKQHMTPEQAAEFEANNAKNALEGIGKNKKNQDNDKKFELVEKALTANSNQNIYTKTKVIDDFADYQKRISKYGIRADVVYKNEKGKVIKTSDALDIIEKGGK